MELMRLLKEFGFIPTAQQEKRIRKQIGQDFVSRSDFNVKNTCVKELKAKQKEQEKRYVEKLEFQCPFCKKRYAVQEQEEGIATEQIDCVKRAREALDSLPNNPRREQRELEIQIRQLKQDYPLVFSLLVPNSIILDIDSKAESE